MARKKTLKDVRLRMARTEMERNKSLIELIRLNTSPDGPVSRRIRELENQNKAAAKVLRQKDPDAVWETLREVSTALERIKNVMGILEKAEAGEVA